MPSFPVSAAMLALNTVKSISDNSAQASQYAAQANYQNQQAQWERDLNKAKESQLRRKQSSDFASGRAGLAARGIDLSSGSALLLQEDQASQDEFDALLARAGGSRTYRSLEYQAAGNRSRAAGANRQGFFDAAGGLLKKL
jgi:hypothetical protein